MAVVSEKYYRPYDSEGLKGNPKKMKAFYHSNRKMNFKKLLSKW